MTVTKEVQSPGHIPKAVIDAIKESRGRCEYNGYECKLHYVFTETDNDDGSKYYTADCGGRHFQRSHGDEKWFDCVSRYVYNADGDCVFDTDMD